MGEGSATQTVLLARTARWAVRLVAAPRSKSLGETRGGPLGLGSSTAEVAQPCVPAIELREVSFSYGKEPFIGGLSAMFSHGA